MPLCTRNRCGKEYVEAENTDSSCVYHSGTPVFHEGLKSWSCCSSQNKPVLDFDEFMKIPGCVVNTHSSEPKTGATTSHRKAPQHNLTNVEMKANPISPLRATCEQFTSIAASRSSGFPTEEEDDLTVVCNQGKTCIHRGCGVAFVSEEENRIGDGPGAICTYHPAPPIFREGSKGYLCCKRRVLEFEEFLKIEGCKKGRHVFIPKPKIAQETEMIEQSITCRYDYYQTPDQVHMTVFAKQADKERCKIIIEATQIHLDLFLPGPKRFKHSINLFGHVLPDRSFCTFYGTKVEITLQKHGNISWPLLEKLEQPAGNITFSFGVGGRTGTTGGKVIHTDRAP